MKNKDLFSRKGLKSIRASLRNRSTSAEAALWEILKSIKLDGRKFRRQYSIGNYIVDFCCPSEKQINHPGHRKSLQYSEYHCDVSTPPSKGGESLMNKLNINI
jgi:hypothetical protein